ncbi:phosphatase PAP2 family protein [Nocardiopsis sp. HUAS JQ3]|uniref:phosphatase PAP2 family protein n=1 Tax=Nocardiopsis sp. HUAS JQ3 TaxID=3061629 RepID=UPI0023A95BAC|nr:phosphatase PAP2 family protein [Nocardiopsis sp. HUAS JQ3]WDZ91018.1 phosphatase PAP2 family protein [Nocardiopsis sp. HUAS JQ3]
MPLAAPLIVTAVLALLALTAYPGRERVFTAVAGSAERSELAPLVGTVAELGLLALVATAGVLAAWCWFRSRRRFWPLAFAGLGVIAAYVLSEGVKLLVAQPRPCDVVDIATVLTCPGAGDWSWPSNHSVLAAAFAAACVLTVRRIAWLTVPLALVIATSRVAAGVHYAHDVLSGLAFGLLVVTVVVAVVRSALDTRFVRGSAPARSRRVGAQSGGDDD